MLIGIRRGIIGFITTSILTGVCIVLEFDPGLWSAGLITSPPNWLMHPLTKLGALALGALFGFFSWKLRPWRKNDAESAKSENQNSQVDDIKRDVTLRDACFYCAFGDWQHEDWGGPNAGSKEGMNKLLKAQKNLEQAACDGEIAIWGRQPSSDRFIKIPEKYWENHGVGIAFMMYDNPEDWKTERRTGGGTEPIYVELRTNKSQVMELCRAVNT